MVYEWLVGSNGMAAGNTIEEALVQSLSEICERYVMKQVIENQIIMPDVPKEEYLKYTKISRILHQYNKNGYIVHIKDASLGLQLPVICTIIYDPYQDTYTYTFGAHPSLPVAIERCLTEYAQGVDITSKNNYKENLFLCIRDKILDETNKEKTNNITFDNSNGEVLESKIDNCSEKSQTKVQTIRKAGNLVYSSEYIEKELYEYLTQINDFSFLFEKQFVHRVDIENCECIRNVVLNKESSYLYDKDSWINNIDVDNNFLLNFLLKKIQKYTNEIYIRDVSFLGFPAVRVVIPKMSLIFNYDKDRITLTKKWIDWLKTEFKDEREQIRELYKSIEIEFDLTFHLDSQFSDLPIEYILLLCAIYLNDGEKIILLTDIIIRNNDINKFFKEDFIVRVKIIREYFKLKLSDYNAKQISEHIISSFGIEDVKKFWIFMRYLSPLVITTLIKPFTPKRNVKKEVQYSEEIQEIINKIVKKQKENIINQSDFISIFNKL